MISYGAWYYGGGASTHLNAGVDVVVSTISEEVVIEPQKTPVEVSSQTVSVGISTKSYGIEID